MKNVGAVVLLFLAAFAASALAAGPGRGLKTLPTCCEGNIRPKDVTCPSGTVKCTVDGIREGQKVQATCAGNCKVWVKFASDKESVTFTGPSGNEINNIKAWIKGGPGYCLYYHGPYDTPKMCGLNDKNRCGFSHAIFCVKV